MNVIYDFVVLSALIRVAKNKQQSKFKPKNHKLNSLYCVIMPMTTFVCVLSKYYFVHVIFALSFIGMSGCDEIGQTYTTKINSKVKLKFISISILSHVGCVEFIKFCLRMRREIHRQFSHTLRL